MSGITPLLDTLLHQVLGPKGDLTAQKNLNQPVRAVDPGEGPRALQSDSRLDARANSQAHATQPQLRTGGKLAQASYQQLQPLPPTNTSTHTALSNAGRAIADVLMQYPAPGSAIRPGQPLLLPGEPITPTLLNERLEQSIRNSGVFYETTLSKWFRGEAPLHRLQQQPQMQFHTNQTDSAARTAERGIGAPVPEPLQPIVRQQLEMLSTPMLRWEGDIWQGIFMALFLQPMVADPRAGQQQNEQTQSKSAKSWRSELELSVQGLGDLSVGVHLQEKQLHLLFVADENVIHKLAGKESILRERLSKLGLTEVNVETRNREAPNDE
ncbi:MAG: flagellar hook-length control protein FliK [Idiomarina sp.]|nr:flagellar hook-length control protein FliK [Idiomarina sp.]